MKNMTREYSQATAYRFLMTITQQNTIYQHHIMLSYKNYSYNGIQQLSAKATLRNAYHSSLSQLPLKIKIFYFWVDSLRKKFETAL